MVLQYFYHDKNVLLSAGTGLLGLYVSARFTCVENANEDRKSYLLYNVSIYEQINISDCLTSEFVQVWLSILHATPFLPEL